MTLPAPELIWNTPASFRSIYGTKTISDTIPPEPSRTDFDLFSEPQIEPYISPLTDMECTEPLESPDKRAFLSPFVNEPNSPLQLPSLEAPFDDVDYGFHSSIIQPSPPGDFLNIETVETPAVTATTPSAEQIFGMVPARVNKLPSFAHQAAFTFHYQMVGLLFCFQRSFSIVFLLKV